jgi:hypothetical protein
MFIDKMGSTMGEIHSSFWNRDSALNLVLALGYVLNMPCQIRTNSISGIGAYPLLCNTLSYCVLGCRRNSGASTAYYTRLVVVTALLGRTCWGQNSWYRACNLHRRARTDGVTSLVCSKNRETIEEHYYYYYYWNSAHVESESKSDTGNNRGEWNYFKSTQTTLE